MEPKNLLAESVSPYLLQHRDNPVHWRPWGGEAFEEARSSRKPVLLSIGYAACHWCHVMAHESFEDTATAAVMNELFVSIKVDREERPDVDHLYMTALHSLGQQGGWPLTMFLTPDAEPFWGGTYFPKEARYGRPSFVQVLREVADVFHRDPARVRHNAEALRSALGQRPATATSEPGELTSEVLDTYAERLAGAMDRSNGGLRGAPKFPNASLLLMLWRAGKRRNRDDLTDLVLLTLDRICRGGIFDHLGGGFARYSVDERWLVPHFEKMLYDNAQLLDLLTLAYARTHRETFARAARDTVAWLIREMTTPEGAFCASLDADSEGVEGKFYVWNAREIQNVLGAEDAAFFARFYDVTPQGNWHDEQTGESSTILNRLRSTDPTPEEEARLAGLRAKLFEQRTRRIRPGLDDKVLADWNGLMISALVHAAGTFDEPAWIAVAEKAFRFIATGLAHGSRLGHAWRAGRLTFPGFASDYTAMINAALSLFEATNDRTCLDRAIAWAEALRLHHLDPARDLLTISADDADDVPLRLTPTIDEAVPNAHGQAVLALLRLSALTGDQAYRARADALIAAGTPAVQRDPFSHASLLNALDFRLHALDIVIAGSNSSHLRRAALALPFPIRNILTITDVSQLAPDHPARAQAEAAGTGTAFVCTEGRCSLPVLTPDELSARVREMSRADKSFT